LWWLQWFGVVFSIFFGLRHIRIMRVYERFTNIFFYVFNVFIVFLNVFFTSIRHINWLTDWLTGWKTPWVTVVSSVERTVPSRSWSTSFPGSSMTPFRSRQLIQRENDFCCTPAPPTQTMRSSSWRTTNAYVYYKSWDARAMLHKSNFRFRVWYLYLTHSF